MDGGQQSFPPSRNLRVSGIFDDLDEEDDGGCRESNEGCERSIVRRCGEEQWEHVQNEVRGTNGTDEMNEGMRYCAVDHEEEFDEVGEEDEHEGMEKSDDDLSRALDLEDRHPAVKVNVHWAPLVGGAASTGSVQIVQIVARPLLHEGRSECNGQAEKETDEPQGVGANC